jgi:hypothetical protein
MATITIGPGITLGTGITFGALSGITDPYFSYVTMLLHGDGTNGAQNNTFLDSSTNNFSITRNGNTTQGSFSPYGSNWSNYIRASNYFNTTSSAALGMGTGDFTVEAWIFATAAFSGYNAIFADGFTSGSLYFGNTAGGFGLRAGSVGDILVTTAPSINQWVHVAVTRSGTTVRLFYNGVQQATTTNSTNFPTQSGYVGNDGGGAAFTGYISNLRIVKGTAVYTSAFTPSTTPLTAISGTSLLTCQSNRFIDNSTNNFAITVNGTPSVQRFSPFSPTAAYSTSVIGGSGYFDGSGDYLAGPSNSAFAFGTGDFTMECWLYPTSFSGTYQTYISTRTGTGTGADIQLYNGTTLMLGNQSGSIVSANNVLTLNTWQHIAATRSGTTNRLFVNGVIVASGTASDNFTSTGCYISSGQGGGNNYAIGYITDTRIVKGTAVYTAAFTPPTAPLTAITNTSLLTNFTNGGISDNAMINNLETVGNAQISTSVFKYGTGSMYFDGAGDYLVPNGAGTNLGFVFGTGDFTIEFWVYFISGLGADIVLYDSRPISTNGVYPTIYVNSSSQLSYVVSTSDRITSSSAFTTSQWYHVALCRSGSSTKMFINGTQVGSTYSDTNNYLNPVRRPVIAINGYNETAAPLNGYIDDLRITKGYARYTTTFTPPAAALPDQ